MAVGRVAARVAQARSIPSVEGSSRMASASP